MRFHLRHASASSSFKLCLLKTSSLCLARRASRPFFFPLASTKPPLSELGRSFGLFAPPAPLGALGKPSAVFGSHSLEIFLSAPLMRLFRVAGPGFIQALFRVPPAAGLFIPSPCWRAEKSTIPHLFVNFFRDVFCDLLRSKSKKYLIINVLHFYFFLIKKPLSARKRPKRFRSPKFLSTFCLLHSFSS